MPLIAWDSGIITRPCHPLRGICEKSLAFRLGRGGPFRLMPRFLATFDESPLCIVRRALRGAIKPRPIFRQSALLLLQPLDFLFVAVRHCSALFKLGEDQIAFWRRSRRRAS